MARSFVVFALAFAGVFLLAGAGWALVAGACLVFALWPRGADDWVTAAFARSVVPVRRWVARVKAAPRRATAVGGMTAGVALAPVGLGLATTAGTAVAAAGVLLIGVAVLAGWGA